MTAQKTPLYRPTGNFDILQIPVIGKLLKGRWGRLLLQVPFFVAAVLIMLDGFVYPDTLASQNLATVAPWVHYRGLVIVALLLTGNIFCMGCPFTVPRTLAKRLAISGRRFPQKLRNKWIAIAGLFITFFLYEWLDLWASPLLTAWVIVFYFVASFVLEAIFTESAFCKYVCPLGTFNFVYSTASPTHISVKNHDVCATCVGKECVNGSYSPTPMIRIDEIAGGKTKEVKHSPAGTLGCGTLLFAPQMNSNMDCTFCLDCVRACPHDNIGLMVRQPGAELFNPQAFPKRWDMAFLVIMLVFTGIFNAFGMVPPVYELQQSIADILNTTNEFWVLLIFFGFGNIILPVLVALLIGQMTRILTGTMQKISLRNTITAFAPAFIPLGLGIWFAHYIFHFLIGPLTIIPVFQEFLGFTGNWERFNWSMSESNIGLIQVVALVGGFLWTMMIAQRTSLRLYKRQGMIGLMPWALLFLILILSAIRVFTLPMEMRGFEALLN